VNRLYRNAIDVVRVLLDVQLVVNALNWWVKLIDPGPRIVDFAAGKSRPGTSVSMQGLNDTHFIFHSVKAVELISGALLLANCMVPFAREFGCAVCIVHHGYGDFLQYVLPDAGSLQRLPLDVDAQDEAGGLNDWSWGADGAAPAQAVPIISSFC